MPGFCFALRLEYSLNSGVDIEIQVSILVIQSKTHVWQILENFKPCSIF